MKHLLSILILLGFMTVGSNAKECSKTIIELSIYSGNASKEACESNGCEYLPEKKLCYSKEWGLTEFGDPAIGPKYDLSDIGSGLDTNLNYPDSEKTSTEIQNNTVLIISLIFVALIIYLLLSASVKKTKEAYKASTIPLKNKVKRKELETRLSELEEVTPAEQTYAKSSYEDETEEIREVKKLERQIKIKKLKKELKDLEAEEE